MIAEQVKQDYFARSGDAELSPNGNVESHEEHGFCVWKVGSDKLILVHVYGNGKYWNAWAEDKAKELQLSKIFFATKRNPDGFVKRHGYNVIGYILEREL